MPKATKYNAFGGVFTPSVLTILGVIMYSRLGIVVGEAGIIGALVIVFVSHIISITTGLSVSSIATDKKVKAGGLYYILSRSLGLPIGGAIGITLVLGTALSISLYLVGFAESFNNFLEYQLGLPVFLVEPYAIQITGTLILTFLTIISLISTSLVIKTQYYIMAAIFLSLVSILVGGAFLSHGFEAQQTFWFSPQMASRSASELFGIFFPAVTGFTAGVAMSGDLRDPKRAIPIGTMAAIAVGFLVYVGLTFFIGFQLDNEALRTDTNILSKITVFADRGAPFLLAGFWGATLSSALGGLLGAPRILQAISLDKITPKIFAHGVGTSNEPRNALLFTIIIAEFGILIGELDRIAEVVSMFYLTAYGFINLTSLLESWSGSEFRPQFKIPGWVSLLGTIATFVVMFQLNAVAMLVAFIIIGALFLYLKRKQVSLGFGDIWQGVWSEVVRLALYRMSRRSAEDRRNWRPNIILFSGGSEKRPHLVDFGQWVVGRLGVLSNFDLVENKDAKVLFTKSQQVVTKEDDSLGVFTRRYQCRDIYLGIESIAETYGFSGIEPNTILMGWARRSAQRNDFVRTLEKLHLLDYNLLLVDYDDRVGYGKEQSIDIWWQGHTSDIMFALTTLRFLTSSSVWKRSKVRLLVILEADHINILQLERKIEELLEEQRVVAEVRIIENDTQKRSFGEIVYTESLETDLIFLELPPLSAENQDEFFSQTNQLCKQLGTVVLYRAASQFSEVTLDIDLHPPENRVVKEEQPPETPEAFPEIVPDQEISWTPPQEKALEARLQYLKDSMDEWVGQYYEDYLHNIEIEYQKMLEQVLRLWQHHEAPKPATFVWRRTDTREQSSKEALLSELASVFAQFYNRQAELEKDLLRNGQRMLQAVRERFIRDSPNILEQTYFKGGLRQKPNYPEVLRNFSWQERLLAWFSSGKITHHFRYEALLSYFLWKEFEENYFRFMENYLSEGWHFHEQLQKTFRQMNEADVQEREALEEGILRLIAENKRRFQKLIENWKLANVRLVGQLSEDVNLLVVNQKVRHEYKLRRTGKRQLEAQLDVLDRWVEQLPLMVRSAEVYLILQTFGKRFRKVVRQFQEELRKHLYHQSVEPLQQLRQQLEKLKEEGIPDKDKLNALRFREGQPDYPQEVIDSFLLNFKGSTHYLPTQVRLLSTETIRHLLDTNWDEEPEEVTFSLPTVVNYSVQTHFTEPTLQKINQAHDYVHQSYSLGLDVVRILSFSLNNPVQDEPESHLHDQEQLQKDLVRLVDEEIRRIDQQQDELETQIAILLEQIEIKSVKALEQFTPDRITALAENLDKYLRSQNRIRALNRFSKLSRQFSQRTQNYLTDFVFRQQERLQLPLRQPEAPTEQLAAFAYALTPKPKVLERLPFYYKQLFLRQHTTSKELWQGRERELSQVQEALERHRAGYGGALLITGEPGAGKAHLTDYVIEHFLSREQVYTIDPPRGGSAEMSVFRRIFRKSVRLYGSFQTLLDRLPEGSVLVFNHIEMWWERHPDGQKVVQALENMIRTYSRKHLFILNANHYTLNFWEQQGQFRRSFLQTITCLPLTGKELQQVILLRHQSSRMEFVWDGEHESKLSAWQRSRLFHQYFQFSKGNVGTALQGWMSHIERIEDQTVYIRLPKTPNIQVLATLEREEHILLTQLLLHKQLSLSRLARIMDKDSDLLFQRLKDLQHIGLTQSSGEFWQLNRFTQPFVVRFLESEHYI